MSAANLQITRTYSLQNSSRSEAAECLQLDYWGARARLVVVTSFCARDISCQRPTCRSRGRTHYKTHLDPRLPSVCSLITGAPVRGSWWSHPFAHAIFHVSGQLADHADVLITKLI